MTVKKFTSFLVIFSVLYSNFAFSVNSPFGDSVDSSGEFSQAVLFIPPHLQSPDPITDAPIRTLAGLQAAIDENETLRYGLGWMESEVNQKPSNLLTSLSILGGLIILPFSILADTTALTNGSLISAILRFGDSNTRAQITGSIAGTFFAPCEVAEMTLAIQDVTDWTKGLGKKHARRSQKTRSTKKYFAADMVGTGIALGTAIPGTIVAIQIAQSAFAVIFVDGTTSPAYQFPLCAPFLAFSRLVKGFRGPRRAVDRALEWLMDGDQARGILLERLADAYRHAIADPKDGGLTDEELVTTRLILERIKEGLPGKEHKSQRFALSLAPFINEAFTKDFGYKGRTYNGKLARFVAKNKATRFLRNYVGGDPDHSVVHNIAGVLGKAFGYADIFFLYNYFLLSAAKTFDKYPGGPNFNPSTFSHIYAGGVTSYSTLLSAEGTGTEFQRLADLIIMGERPNTHRRTLTEDHQRVGYRGFLSRLATPDAAAALFTSAVARIRILPQMAELMYALVITQYMASGKVTTITSHAPQGSIYAISEGPVANALYRPTRALFRGIESFSWFNSWRTRQGMIDTTRDELAEWFVKISKTVRNANDDYLVELLKLVARMNGSQGPSLDLERKSPANAPKTSSTRIDDKKQPLLKNEFHQGSPEEWTSSSSDDGDSRTPTPSPDKKESPPRSPEVGGTGVIPELHPVRLNVPAAYMPVVDMLEAYGIEIPTVKSEDVMGILQRIQEKKTGVTTQVFHELEEGQTLEDLAKTHYETEISGFWHRAAVGTKYGVVIGAKATWKGLCWVGRQMRCWGKRKGHEASRHMDDEADIRYMEMSAMRKSEQPSSARTLGQPLLAGE